jgi:uncharacterized protein YbjQ (UPF0145 family)
MDKTTGEYHFTRLEMVLFGVGKVEVLGRELSRRGAKRTLIVTGKTLGQSKLLDKVKSAAGTALAGVFTGAAQHVPSQTVTELVAEARRVGADAMVSFGGGSPIDTVKNAAWQLMGGRAGSRTIDFAGAATTSGSGGEILHIAIPTTLSAGEFTPGGGVTDESTKVKGVVADPRLQSPGGHPRSRADSRDAGMAVGLDRDARARSRGRGFVLDAPSAGHRHAREQGDRAAERAPAAVAANAWRRRTRASRAMPTRGVALDFRHVEHARRNLARVGASDRADVERPARHHVIASHRSRKVSKCASTREVHAHRRWNAPIARPGSSASSRCRPGFVT